MISAYSKRLGAMSTEESSPVRRRPGQRRRRSYSKARPVRRRRRLRRGVIDSDIDNDIDNDIENDIDNNIDTLRDANPLSHLRHPNLILRRVSHFIQIHGARSRKTSVFHNS